MRRMKLTVILGALLAGTVLLTTGCAQPDDGTKIEKPSNNNNNNQNNNQQGSNQGNNNQGGNQGGNNNNDKNYAQPYDRNLSNGYVIHNFIGQGTAFPKETVEADTNYYLGKAETYIKGMVSDLNASVKGRNAATQNYFKKFINGLSNNNNYKVGTYSFDDAVIANVFNSEYILEDIVSNLDHIEQGYSFQYGFKLLANEAFKENDNFGVYNAEYNADQEWAIYMLNELEMNNGQTFDSDKNSSTYPKATQLVNNMLDVAAGNMNARNGYDLTASDLRQALNIIMTNNSLYAVHNTTKTNLEHTGTCSIPSLAPNEFGNYWDNVVYDKVNALPAPTAEMSVKASSMQGMVR